MLDQENDKIIKKISLAEFAEQARGVPYAKIGSGALGWNCWQMVRQLYRKCFAIDLPDLGYCCRLPYRRARVVFDSLAVAYREVPRGRERPGDVLILRGESCHAAVVVRSGLMLHVDETLGTCVEPFTQGFWKNRIEGVFRHGELAGSH